MGEASQAISEFFFEGEDLHRLHHLAHLNGVGTDFWDWSGGHRDTPPHTLLAVLHALGVPVDHSADPAAVEAAIAWSEDDPWRQTLPRTSIARHGQGAEITVNVPDGWPVWVTAIMETGDEYPVPQLDRWVQPREVDGVMIGRATFSLPASLPLGYHSLRAYIGEGDAQYQVTRPLYVVPDRLEPSALAGERSFWGVAAQAYSLMSEGSWGTGDAADLADLMAICGAEGADFLLINPLHVPGPAAPIEDSPYLPVSRRWLNVSYIRPEQVPEYAQLGARRRAKIERLHQQAVGEAGAALIDRDRALTAKMSALELIYPLPRSIAREAQFEAFIESGGEELYNFALWCVLVEHYGTYHLPLDARSPRSPVVRQLADENADRVRFFQWCQWVAAAQIGVPQQISWQLGMPIGLMADLAVGVHPRGAEYWSDPTLFAAGMTVGAPPDMYSQLGQDWSQPPWNPRALEETGYAAVRDMFRSAMILSGALRIDHIMGLFRLWWIPAGESATEGAYVSFNHEAMVGILLLEAQRQDIVVIGEDLGTVEPWVRQFLADRGILGTSVFWFEKDHGGNLLPPESYRRDILATVNTHDLPPTAGYLQGEHTRLRHELDLLVEPVEQVRANDAAEREMMLARLREWGLLGDDPTDTEIIEAMHRYVSRAPSRLKAAALVDAVGELRPQNLPGTHRGYPNWRVPLAGRDGERILVEDLPTNEQMRRLFAIMREENPRAEA